MRDENAMRPEDFAEEHALLARDDVYSSSTGCANNVWLQVQSSAFAVIWMDYNQQSDFTHILYIKI